MTRLKFSGPSPRSSDPQKMFGTPRKRVTQIFGIKVSPPAEITRSALGSA